MEAKQKEIEELTQRKRRAEEEYDESAKLLRTIDEEAQGHIATALSLRDDMGGDDADHVIQLSHEDTLTDVPARRRLRKPKLPTPLARRRLLSACLRRRRLLHLRRTIVRTWVVTRKRTRRTRTRAVICRRTSPKGRVIFTSPARTSTSPSG